jgi:hypothetical protein
MLHKKPRIGTRPKNAPLQWRRKSLTRFNEKLLLLWKTKTNPLRALSFLRSSTGGAVNCQQPKVGLLFVGGI